jgi:phosphoglucomutase
MTVSTIPAGSFPDRRPGTPGPRKKVSLFRQTGYLEAFVQSIFGALPEAVGDDAILYHLSGTGTEKATLRVYLERFEPDPARHQTGNDAALAPLAATAAVRADRPNVVA